jgi:hypothetical protein
MPKCKNMIESIFDNSKNYLSFNIITKNLHFQYNLTIITFYEKSPILRLFTLTMFPY